MRLFLVLLAGSPLFAQCSYVLDATSFTVGPAAVSGTTVQVAAPDNCKWTATVPASTTWLHVTFGQSGTGNGSFGWAVDRATTPSNRTGVISVGTTSLTINQTGAACTYSILPNLVNPPLGGGPATFQVKTNCQWTASSNASWLTIPPNQGTTSDGPLNYNVSSNGCVSSRTATVTVALPGAIGTQYSTTARVTQDGSPNNLTVAPTSLAFSSAVQDGNIAVTTGTGCAWSAFSDVSWVQISPSNGLSSRSIAYHLPPNNSAARSGNIHIGQLLIPVTQAANPVPIPGIGALTNAASGASGAVSPGEIVSLFGSTLGPTPGVPLQLTPDGKSITTSLAGVQVLFDGTPAPLTYVGATQINAVVPYGVAGRSSTSVTVQYQSLTSAAVSYPVQDTTPGIFTQDNSGIGPGAILNQDYSLNTTSRRAARGEFVMVYCTGAGVTNPASVDAAITGLPLPLITQPVSVTIGGLDAQVLYQGGTPSSIAGLYQINVKIPDNVTPGPAVPIVVTVGGQPSQSGVAIAIR